MKTDYIPLKPYIFVLAKVNKYMCPSFRYWLNIILLLVYGLTIFMADLEVNSEFDLRRIIALSTLRQLGLMIITISSGLSGLTFFPIY
jgi:formate hydrogenlyase subunit 3/multisubunit Na+/H+ antiporter MnhD subunit